ncbi:hypothetical protein MferCBS31731_000907 [Microsporum ferrugineum]
MTSTYTQWLADAKEDSSFDLADLETLELYLGGSLGIDSAAEQLTEGKACQDVENIWVMLLVLSKCHSEILESIVSLIRTIFALRPSDDDESSEEWSVNIIRSFSVNWRDVHDALWSDRRQMKHVSDPAGQNWINYHAFSAACIREGILTDLYWAYIIIVDGLERKVRYPITPQQDADVAAACQYFIHGASHILRNGCQPEYGETLRGWGDESELWQGEKGLTPGRWTFWGERLDTLRLDEGFSDETREAARRGEAAI